ncbi:MAG: hypothetical protein ACYCOX_06735 [Acidobacteriaceae bacterium]
MKPLCWLALIASFAQLLGAQTPVAAKPSSQVASKLHEDRPKRFFSNDSFWNQTLPEHPEIDPRSNYWIHLMETDAQKSPGLGINATRYTIPVYEVDANTPLKTVLPNSTFYRHAKDFPERVPIPDKAVSDNLSDHHLALIDWASDTGWDMWEAIYRNGQWYSNTGIRYKLDGSGVFSTAELGMKNNDSVHQYGPGRASGVPIIAGLIMYREAEDLEIDHKIAGATRFVAFHEFVFPAAWTDGDCEGGIPEGAVLQLDPKLDLSKFDLTPEEKAVAQAMQRYGVVLVDYANGNVIYAEGLYGQNQNSWSGKLREWSGGIVNIPLEHYRVLAVKNSVHEGLARRDSRDKYNPHCRAQTSP